MSSQTLSGKVPLDALGKRLDVAVASLFPEYSRKRLQDWMKQELLTVDGEVCTKLNQKVFGGERIVLQAEIEAAVSYEAQDIPIEVVYEDDDILVINKPIGLVVHPGAGNPDGTLLNALLFYLPSLREVPRAGIVHRLDKETSGLMVVAKTVPSQTFLVAQLQEHLVERVYDAISVGKIISGGKIEKAIGRNPHDRKKMAAVNFGGKPAVSHYRVLERFIAHTYVRVKLETGRTHQIRVHMASIGFPLIGDPVYGARLRIPKKMMEYHATYLRHFKRQALHAGQLSLTHPVTGKTMKWRAPLPDDMMELMELLREDTEMFNHQNDEFDDFDYDHGVEVEWVTDEDAMDH